MTSPMQRFVPTWRAALAETALVALIAPTIVVALFVLRRGKESLPFALLFAGVFGIGLLGYFSFRFRRKAPREVVLDERAIELHGPGEQVRTLEWARMEKAVHRSKSGLQWVFDPGPSEEDLVLRDDGFTTARWDELTKAIRLRLDACGVPHESEGLASAFDD